MASQPERNDSGSPGESAPGAGLPVVSQSVVPVEAAGLAIMERGLPAPHAPSLFPDGSGLLRILRRHIWSLLALGTILSGLAMAAVAIWFPMTYAARARFHVAAKAPIIAFDTQGSADFANYQRTQTEFLKSQLVLRTALQRPDVALLPIVRQQAAPAEWLEQQLIVDFPAPEIMRIVINGKDPKELEILLKAVRDAYLKEIVNKEKSTRLEQLEKLTAVRTKWEGELSRQRLAYREKAREAGSGDPQTLAFAHRLALESLAQSKKDLLQYQSELRRLEAELAFRKDHGPTTVESRIPVSDRQVELQVRQDREVIGLGARIAELEKKISDHRLAGVVGEDHPTMRKLQLELKAAKASLREREQTVREQVRQENKEDAAQGTKAGLVHLQEQIGVLRELEQRLQREIDSNSKDSQNIKNSTLDLDALREAIAQTENIAKTVATRAEALKVELEAPSRVTALEEPTITGGPNFKRKLIAFGVAVASGYTLVLLGFLSWEILFKRRIHEPEELVAQTGIPLVATVPAFSRLDRGPPKEHAAAPDLYLRNLLTESVDRARIRLLQAARMHELQVVGITSAIPGEGKTSLATQLAASLARSGRRILLIDGDLRRPAVHRVLSLGLEPGLSDVLRNEVAVEAAIRHISTTNLSILTAGRSDEHVINALGCKEFLDLLRRLQAEFDLILLDTAPVLAVVDTPLLLQSVDAVLFSVLCGVSRPHMVFAAYKELDAAGTRILGAVVSGVRRAGQESYYHQYYSASPPG